MSLIAIKNSFVFTVDTTDTIYLNGTIIINNDRIEAVGCSEQIIIPEGAQVIDGKGRLAILPGLIDTHSHSSLLKGFSENLNLMEWLPIYQREHQVITEEDAYAAGLVNYLEAIKGGTTCIVDMFRKLHKCAQAAQEVGIRVNLVPYVADALGKEFFETLDDNENLIKSHHGADAGRIRVSIGLEHLFYCSEKAYSRARDMAAHYHVSIHTHTSELEPEVTAVINHFGKRPIHLFKERGILGSNTFIAHCVWLDDEEIKILADTGTSVAHCATSNAKLAGGIAPLHKYHALGVKVGLGSDGGISNNSLSIWEEMKFSSLFQKVLHYDAAALPAPKVLRMATIEGARVLGLDKEIGSLEVGKKADIITVDLWQPHLFPLTPSEGHNPVIWNLIYAARASDVKDIWVDGRLVVKNGQCTRVNEQEILEFIHTQTISLLKRRQATQAKSVL